MDQVTTTLRALSTWQWILIAAAALVVLVIAIVGFLWWRRRKPREPAPVEAPPVAKKPDLGKQLIADARAFRRGLPAIARRSYDSFQPAVVLGTESSGKMEIIERFSGVAHRRIDLGDRIDHAGGQLRCVLGGDVVVFEPSAEVVHASREQVSAGLTRALAPTLRKRPPIVVVCVSPEVLDTYSAPQLTELGGQLRAKIDILANVRDEACTVRVVMSDVPGFARFDALFDLVAQHRIDPILSIDHVDEPALSQLLLRYADQIGAAAADLPLDKVLALLGFLEKLPQLASSLAILLGELFAPAGFLTPHPDGLYLVPTEGGPNPFALADHLARPGTSALHMHRVIAFSAAAAASALLLIGFRNDAGKWSRAVAAATGYDLKSNQEVERRTQLRLYGEDQPTGTLDRLLPAFFVDGPGVVACGYGEKIRRDALIPALEDVLARPPERDRPERTLYIAALLYADRDSKLGTMIREHVDDWAVGVGLTPSQVNDYLLVARANRDERWLDKMLDAGQPQHVDDAGDHLARFLTLLAPDHAWTEDGIAEITGLVEELRPALHDLAAFSAAQRVLTLAPMDRLAPAFKVHTARFALLSQLHDNQVALHDLLAVVADAVHKPAEAAPADPAAHLHSFVELAAALAPLAVDSVSTKRQTLSLAGHDYTVDPAGLLRALRGGEIERVIDAFIAGAGDGDGPSSLFLAASRDRPIALPIAWPAGTTGATSHALAYTREVFESDVKGVALSLHTLLDKLPVRPELRDRIARMLADSLDGYALAYEAELERLVSSFRVDFSSEVAAQRVLRTLAGTASPLRALLAAVAQDARLGLAADKSGVFDAMAEVENHFGPIGDLFATGKGGDALVGYQDVLRMVSARLTAPRAGKLAAASAPVPTDAITARLSPAGALAFAAAEGAADSPIAALDTWLADKPLTDDLADLFRAPVRAVHALGARNVDAALAAWGREIETAADADVFSRFPFDRRASDDVDPQSLTDWLQPKRGRFARDVVPALAGLVAQTRGWDSHVHYEPAHTCGDDVCIRVPPALLATLDRLAATSALLWDDAGKPRPLEIAVTPRPFALAATTAAVPELVRLTVGASSVFYFNQRPKRSVLSLDWTREQPASLSVQLKQDGGLSLTPPAVVAAGSPWSFFHLLQQAEHHGSTYTWRIALGVGQVLAVSCDVLDRASPQLSGADALVSRGPR